MQDDITWGVKHLVAQGIADPKRVAILGGSYGGYATLAGVAFTPDVYAAGRLDRRPVEPHDAARLDPAVLGSGPQDVPHADGRSDDARKGRSSSSGSRRSTPPTKIKTPLLVVQGANDPRVKKAESDQIVVALRDRKFPVEYIVAPDEGHGFARPVNNMAMYAGDREVPVAARRHALPGIGAARRLRAPAGDHRRSRDRQAGEAGRHDDRDDAGAVAADRDGAGDLRRDDRARRAVDEDGVEQHRHRSRRHAHRDRDDEDAAGRGVGRVRRSTRPRSPSRRARSSRGRWS